MGKTREKEGNQEKKRETKIIEGILNKKKHSTQAQTHYNHYYP